MRRHLARLALILAIIPACAPPAVEAPKAVAPSADTWEKTVPVSSAEAYAVVLGVLTDSSYLIQRSDAETGIVETKPRRDRPLRYGLETAGSQGFSVPADAGASTVRYEGFNYPITLRATVTPAGTDSARIAIAGIYMIQHNQSARILARSAEWRYVTGVGSAVLNRVGVAR
jgi:hypothetical protein